MCFFKKKVDPDKLIPVSTEKISGAEVNRIIRSQYPSEGQVFLADNDYFLCHYDDIALFLAQDETNKMGYVAEDRDCDDFAYRLMGQFSIPQWSALAFGIIWVSGHALNCMISEDRELLFIEPQTDEINDSQVGEMVFITM